MKKTYTANTNTNFSIAGEDFYLIAGQDCSLPDHDLINDMVRRGHLTLKENTNEEIKSKK